MTRTRQRIAAAAATVLVAMAWQDAPSVHAATYGPPQDVYISPRTLEAIRADITAGRPADAVDRIEGLYADPSAQLVKIDEQQVVSIRDWVDGQLTDTIFPTRFREQYEKVAGEVAQNALADAVHAGDVRGMLAVAERYPWTIAAQQAPAEAAQRLLAIGDVRGARDLAARAGELGELPAVLQGVAQLPMDSQLGPTAFSTTFLAAKPKGPTTVAPAATAPRVVPVASEQAVYVAAPDALLALSRQGTKIWSTRDPQPELPPPPKDVPASLAGVKVMDSSLSQPAVWCDISGQPRVLVARQTSPLQSALRAVRPQDGTVLWTTASAAEEGDADGQLVFAGTPTINGRYVYSLAIGLDSNRGHRLCVVALELASGRVLFRSEITDAERRMAAQVRKLPPGIRPAQLVIGEFVYSDSTAVTSDERHVYVAPGGGPVWCLDRFSGAVRWIGSYPARPVLTSAQQKAEDKQREKERAERRKKGIAEPPNLPVMRWQNRVFSNGQVAVVAAVDSFSVVGLDAGTGRIRWQSEEFKDADLVAIHGEIAVLASSTRLVGLRTGTGEVAWETPLEAAPTGPAFQSGENVGVLSGTEMQVFAIETGQEQRAEISKVSLDALLRTPPGRSAVQAAGLLEAFGEPPAPPAPQKPTKPAGKK